MQTGLLSEALSCSLMKLRNFILLMDMAFQSMET
ncbi:hypothetical protein U703_14340 [Rhodobacter capsulatus YW1]|nr:hypothetical protein U703_14340 [Rhodobacter capsulatus YW1]